MDIMKLMNQSLPNLKFIIKLEKSTNHQLLNILSIYKKVALQGTYMNLFEKQSSKLMNSNLKLQKASKGQH